jgi:hypothetical protein
LRPLFGVAALSDDVADRWPPLEVPETYRLTEGWPPAPSQLSDGLVRCALDFSNWKDHDAYQKAFERLLRDLKADRANAKEF